MKKIFILTGEPSGDKLASKVISQLQKSFANIEFLSVGGENLKLLGINSIFDQREITYLGFTKVLLNLFKIKKKIAEATKKILEFRPDILFSVDSPDFTLRVAERVKKINPKIKVIHYVAPQVWVWRENRIKKFKKFVDHFLLLFNFEKKYFENENIKSSFVGHALLESNNNSKIDIKNIMPENKDIISIFPGSRLFEINNLMPILIDFIMLANKKYTNCSFIFHGMDSNKILINDYLNKSNLINCSVISDEKIKNNVLNHSKFAIAKSGTISLEICNANIPSIIIYKLNYINYFIMKLLVKVKFANIINIINNKEVIPELLQSKCKSINIYNQFDNFLSNPKLIDEQKKYYKHALKEIKPDISASKKASEILIQYLV